MQLPAGKRQHQLARSGGQHQAFALQRPQLVVGAGDAQPARRVDADDAAGRAQRHARRALQLAAQRLRHRAALRAHVAAPDLAAGLAALVDDADRRAVARRGRRGSQSGGAGTDHQQVVSLRFSGHRW
ncbi:hypothetical protein GALL_358290 [mine drainage metagenome]|uniref:Uncharacterized protein n=1 Tax=mine drainage metagenome TaxID=410659 RepID=A0A1J5QR69_9ZZZZ